VLAYFALAFAISWGGVLLVIGGLGGIPATREQSEMLLPFVVLAMLAGPSVAGILLTGLVNGKAGLRQVLSRLLRWRVGARWYAVALLPAPLMAAAVLFALSLTSPVFLPGIVATSDKASLLLFGIGYGLAAGLFEEPGWTGFAVPRLRLRYGVLTTGLVVGLLWGAWHFLVAFWGSGSPSGTLSLALLLPSLLFYVAVLPAYRMLMVWVHDRTGSLLLAMLMHTSLTASLLILQPSAMSGAPAWTWNAVFATAVWGAVAAVAVANRRRHSREPLVSQAA
jgi:membrane protease YdiL (CAAX protease family)